MSFQNENIILLDLDNTLAISHCDKEYSELIFDKQILDSMLLAKKKGYKIKIHTSRNMRSFNGDQKKIKEYTLPIIVDWLKKHNIPYDEIIIGKQWCGQRVWTTVVYPLMSLKLDYFLIVLFLALLLSQVFIMKKQI